VDDVKSQMESVTRLYQQLDEKITDDGGMQNLFGMNRKIRQALESITIGDLDNMLNEIHRAKEGLTRLQENVIEVRVLKEVLSSGPSRGVVNGTARP
jgi:hypothetical protein